MKTRLSVRKGAKIPVRRAVLGLAPYNAPEEGRAGKLRLDFNENTVGCSPGVLRALSGITAEQMAIYPEYQATTKRLASFFGVRPAEMHLTNGIDDALHLIADTFIEDGDTVLVVEPTFDMYRFFAELAGARVVALRYDEQMNFPVTDVLRVLRGAAKRVPRVLYIANPNNPTGTLVQAQDLRRILNAAARSLVLVDEAYVDFSGLTILPWIRRYPNLLVARTFSKSAGLAALRIGCLFGASGTLSAMRRACTPYPVNTAALVAAEATTRDKRFARNYTREVLQSRAMLEKGLTHLGARVYPSAANFILADFGAKARRMVLALERKGILVRERRDFPANGLCAHQRWNTRRYAARPARDRGDPVKLAPKLVIFDVDGVLVDVHGSFHKSIVDTIHFFTGQRVTYAEIHAWKNRSGYNDDWRLTTDWIATLREAVPYAVVKARFQKLYWGTKAQPGNVSRERWLITHARLARWAQRSELALFTGRTRRELRHTLEGTDAKRIFRRAVTMDDVTKGKPDPEGLRLLLNGTSAREALYLGDNIDDALASKRARVPFLGILPHGSEAHRVRAKKLKELGALEILHSVRDLEKLWE